MVAALYRDDKAEDVKHTKDYNRWQISLKYDDPRWKDIADGTVYWYIKSSGGGIIGPSTNAENMDDGTDNSNSSASVHGRMLYKNESSLNSNGTESSFTFLSVPKVRVVQFPVLLLIPLQMPIMKPVLIMVRNCNMVSQVCNIGAT